MSLESCPTCGYALATFGNHCRHCSPRSFSAAPSSSFYEKYLPQLIVALVVMAVLVYFIFFR